MIRPSWVGVRVGGLGGHAAGCTAWVRVSGRGREMSSLPRVGWAPHLRLDRHVPPGWVQQRGGCSSVRVIGKRASERRGSSLAKGEQGWATQSAGHVQGLSVRPLWPRRRVCACLVFGQSLPICAIDLLYSVCTHAGYIDTESLMSAMERLGQPINEMQVRMGMCGLMHTDCWCPVATFANLWKARKYGLHTSLSS